MAVSTDGEHEPVPSANLPKLLAFYLPQFHPIPENDSWWGPGFTEWTNVVRARPLFEGHYQPHLPGELGFYDLRLPETREAQARLAREYGIYGFCYYHYWFHGRRILNRPFDEVLESGAPDFPFALCWANEPWTRNWDARTGTTLVGQKYSHADDRAHIHWLCKAFSDPRYVKIDGRPLMLIYRTSQLPDVRRTGEMWRDEAQKAGFPDLYLCRVESEGAVHDPAEDGLDASVGFLPPDPDRVLVGLAGYREHLVLDYEVVADEALAAPDPLYKRFPAVMVGWDNTARRDINARIYVNTEPATYERWLTGVAEKLKGVRPEENYAFIVAWNEWAEGNHLEPDRRYGRAFLEATQRALARAAGHESDETEPDVYPYLYGYTSDSAIGHVVALVEEYVSKGRRVIDLGSGAGLVGRMIRPRGYGYLAIDADEAAVALLSDADLEHEQCDITDLAKLTEILGRYNDIGAVVVMDVLEHVAQPQAILAGLADWARHHDIPMILSVPNVAHFDLGVGLLLGQWDPRRSGLLDSTHLRFFTNDTLESLVTKAGWRIVGRADFHKVRSEHYPARVLGGLPVPVLSVIDLLARQENRFSTVYQFVWMLRPGKKRVVTSYLDAVTNEGASCEEAELGLQTRTWLYQLVADLTLLEEEVRHLAVNRSTRPHGRRRTGAIGYNDAYELPDHQVTEALERLDELFFRRPDLQESYGAHDEVDLVGLLEWAQRTVEAGGPGSKVFEPYLPALQAAWTYEAGRQTAQLIIDALELDRLDLTPRQRHALSQLAIIYDRSEELHRRFDLDRPGDALALVAWARDSLMDDDDNADEVELLRRQYGAVLASAQGEQGGTTSGGRNPSPG